MSTTQLKVPILTIDLATIHQVDTRNVESLHNMWAVFSHCSASLEEGKRLENLSWRLLNRETICCDALASVVGPAIETPQVSPTSAAVNFISGSTTPVPSRVGAKAMKKNSDRVSSEFQSSHSSKDYTRHTTSNDLEKMVKSITTEKEELRPLSDLQRRRFTTGFQLIPRPCKINAAVSSSPVPPPTLTPKVSSTSIIRGFSPVRLNASPHRLNLPVPSSIPTADISAVAPSHGTQPRVKTMFALGGSSGEESCELALSTRASSREDLLPPQPHQQQLQKKKNAMFSFGGSSNEEDSPLSRKMEEATSSKASVKKQTTFQEEIARRTIREEAIVDDVFETDEEDDVDESAIDDEDDSSDWEDSVEGSGEASVEDKNLFQRVDSRPNLTSRRSLITTMLHQHDRRNALLQAASNSKSTSVLPPGQVAPLNIASALNSVPAAESCVNSTTNDLTPISEIPRSEAKQIVRPSGSHHHHHTQQLALSPRTTRRNMLASELTVSLRQHLLWERKQKSQTANAVLKRRHTAQDVAQLRQYPETSHISDSKDDGKESWENFFEGGLGEYNSRGW